MIRCSTAPFPPFLYGTAWKEGRTAGLTELAIRSGFRGIDTANQRRHYFEAGGGEGLAAAYRSGVVKRDDLFLQTKYTYIRGQDDRLPYDPAASLSRSLSRWRVHSNIWAQTTSTVSCCTVQRPLALGLAPMPKFGKQCGNNVMPAERD
jgi:diketogulonate reductase-like aldo/keto reductase